MLEQLIISVQIILIDIVMAADNAIIIGLIAANFAPDNRKKIIAWGVAAAFVFRIIFAFFADFMFGFAWLKILGGVLLLWVIHNLRQDFFGKNKIRSPKMKSNETQSFSNGVYKVLVADIAISFDNVIGVVGAAKGYFGFMIFGLVLSVVLTGALATYMAKYIQQHIWIAYVGLVFILIVGLQLIIGGLVDLEILNINEEFKKYF